MTDIIRFDLLFDVNKIALLVLVASIAIILIILVWNNKQIDKSIRRLQVDLAENKKHIDVQGTYLSQFNDHFSLLDRKLKNIEETTSIINRDISSMAEGISGEVGVGKAIELARRGASVDEILETSNLRQDQAELIVKFHGSDK